MSRDRTPSSSPRIAVIGGGFGGIAVGVNLLKEGLRDFTVFEKSEHPGGVWWDNRYPGVEVDSPSHLYSFSFMQYDWSRNYAQQDELLRYIDAVIARFGLREHFRLSTAVTSAVWDDEREQYLVTTSAGEEWFDFVVSAVGLLSVPRYPDWAGLDDFDGPVFHTSRWDDEAELDGKRVAIAGTGSTAIQIVSNLAPRVSELLVFQRQPGWIEPKPVIRYTARQRSRLSRPWRYRFERLVKGFLPSERDYLFNRLHIEGTAPNRRGEKRGRDHIATQLAGRPDLQAAVTPDYPYMGKRPIRDSNFYPALTRDNVRLVPNAVASVTEHAIVDATGEIHEVDAIILSTGFQPSSYLDQLPVTGRDGVTLKSYWRGDPTAFLGITVPRFPNFFILYGPNTNGYAILFTIERQAEYAVRSIKRVLRAGASTIETRESFYRGYKRWLNRRMTRTVWPTTNNYYKSEAGSIVTQWVDGCALYWALTTTLLTPSSRVGGRPGRSTR
jgi:cation diffusion facilitator CzcD-associated flavoprotein CzcO